MKLRQTIDKILALVIIFMLIGLAVHAQAPPPSSNPPGAPLDGLSATFLAVAVGYGAAKIRKRKKR